MNYEEWIKREKKIRIKILKSSPVIQKEHLYRVCQECEEICLCHEEICPNCNSQNIQLKVILEEENILSKIRCKERFKKLVAEQNNL